MTRAICVHHSGNACGDYETCPFLHRTREHVLNVSQSVPAVQSCTYFRRGNCHFGSQCLFVHQLNSSPDDNQVSSETNVSANSSSANTFSSINKEKACTFYAIGKCTKGEACRFSHSGDHFGTLDTLSTPFQKQTKNIACIFWIQGTCIKGDSCLFQHTENIPPSSPSFYCQEPPPVILSSPATAASELIEHTSIPLHGSFDDGRQYQSQNEAQSILECEDESPGESNEDQNVSGFPADSSYRSLNEDGSVSPVLDTSFPPSLPRGFTNDNLYDIRVSADEIVDADVDDVSTNSNKNVTQEHSHSVGGEYMEQQPSGNSETYSDSNQNDEYEHQDYPETPFPQTAREAVLEPHWSEYADFLADPNVPFCKFFAQSKCIKGDLCPFRHSLTVNEYSLLFLDFHPVLWTRGGGSAQGHIVGDPGPLKSSPGICKFYPLGKCLNGDACTFIHVAFPQHDVPFSGPQDDWRDYQETPQPAPRSNRSRRPCKFFEYGNCAKGDDCIFSHDQVNNDIYGRGLDGPNYDAGQEDNTMYTDRNNNRRPCKYFREGTCRRGDDCIFLHDAPATGAQAGWDGPTEGWDEPATTGLEEQEEPETRSTTPHANAASGRDDPASTWDESTPWDNPISATDWGESTPAADWGEPTPATDWGEPTPASAWGEPVADNQINETNHRKFSLQKEWAPGICKWFLRGDCRRGNSCKLKHNTESTHINARASAQGAPADDNWQAANDASWSTPWPDPEPGPCTFFAQGRCRKGARCDLRHELAANGHSSRPTEVVAENVPTAADEPTLPSSTDMEDGHKEGIHVKDEFDEVVQEQNAVAEESWATSWPDAVIEQHFPMRIDEPCKYFGQGYCAKGDSCLYLHISPPEESPERHEPDKDEEADEDEVNMDYEDGEYPGQVDETIVNKESEHPLVERSILNCTIRFDPDYSPEEITTAFESRCIFLFNMPSTLSHYEVMELAGQFGEVTDMDMDTNDISTDARLVFTKCAEATKAVEGLDGLLFQSMTLSAKLDMRNAVVNSRKPSLVSYKAKISWPAPSLFAWVHYATITKAKTEASRLDGTVIDGRKIKAAFHSPRRGQTHSFAVQITGLAPDVDKNLLEQFCTETTLLTMGRPTYDGTAIDEIRDVLAPFGPLETFHVLPIERSMSKIVAFARFSSDSIAASAAKSLNGTKHAFLGDGPIWIQPTFHARYVLPARQFNTVRADVDLLCEGLENTCKLHYSATDPVYIHIHGLIEDRRAFGKANAQLSLILRGQALVCEGVNVWDEYFDMPSSARALERINADDTFFIICDKRTQTIRIFGSDMSRGRASTAILKLLKKVKVQRHEIPIQRSLMRPLLTEVLKNLHDDVGPSKVSLDVVSSVLTVRGDTDVLKKVQSTLDSLATSSLDSSAGPEIICPICVHEPLNPVRLSCKHVYCTACLQHYLNAGAHFPLFGCIIEDIADGHCVGRIPYYVVRDLLPTVEEPSFFESSFLGYVRTHPADFFCCPTHNCQSIYRRERLCRTLECVSCFIDICSSCAVRFHEGLTCAEWTLAQCPRCSTDSERTICQCDPIPPSTTT